MSTFKGFNITGIDPNKYPVITANKNVVETQFYLILEPVDGDANSEDQILWNHCFRQVVKRWKCYEDLRHYQQMQMEVPPLEFIPNGDDNAYLCTSEIALNSLRDSIPLIQKLVEKINGRYISFIQHRDRFRADIEQINATHFTK